MMRALWTLAAGLLVAAVAAVPAAAEPMYRWDWGLSGAAELAQTQALAEAPTRWQVASAGPAAASHGDCWQTAREVYGKYLVAFCARTGGRGAYSVRGDGYDCQGRSRWSQQGSRLVYQMDRGTCGPTANWTADRIECDTASVARGRHGRDQMTCIYHPNAAGYGIERFSAFRH